MLICDRRLEALIFYYNRKFFLSLFFLSLFLRNPFQPTSRARMHARPRGKPFFFKRSLEGKK